MRKYKISLIIKEIREITKMLQSIKKNTEQSGDKKLVLLDFSDIEFKTEQDKIKFLQKLEAFIKHLSEQRKWDKMMDYRKSLDIRMCEKRLKELLEIKQRLIDIKIERTIEKEQKELLSAYDNLFLSLDDAIEKEAKCLADF